MALSASLAIFLVSICSGVSLKVSGDCRCCSVNPWLSDDMNSQFNCWIASAPSSVVYVAFCNQAFWEDSIRFQGSLRAVQTHDEHIFQILDLFWFVNRKTSTKARCRLRGRLRRFRISGGISEGCEANGERTLGTLMFLKNVAGVFDEVCIIVNRFSFLWFSSPAVVVVDIKSPGSRSISMFLCLVACLASIIPQDIIPFFESRKFVRNSVRKIEFVCFQRSTFADTETNFFDVMKAATVGVFQSREHSFSHAWHAI